ncbi:MAG: hypothetical protein EOP07_26735, partial [Proteobacteria bacterium]
MKFFHLPLLLLLGFVTTSSGLNAAPSKEAVVEGLRPKKFILSIGMGKFDNAVWRELRFSRKDAGDMYQFFRKD